MGRPHLLPLHRDTVNRLRACFEAWLIGIARRAASDRTSVSAASPLHAVAGLGRPNSLTRYVVRAKAAWQEATVVLRRATPTGCVVGLLLTALPISASGGGSPETTLVIVNADSAISQSVANAYRTLRDIPQSHLVALHDVPALGRIDVNTFRKRIWGPIRSFMAENGLTNMIDTIAYSADFPYAVDVGRDIKKNRMRDDRYRGRIASLTGLTYFARQVEAGRAGYMHRHANLYYRRNLARRPTFTPLATTHRELNRKAERALGSRDYAAATELFRSLLSERPDVYRAWHNLARALAAQGLLEQSWSALEKAVDMGWPNALATRSDKHLRKLRTHPGYDALLQRMESWNGPFEPVRGFRSRYSWGRWGLGGPDDSSATRRRYYLSTLLAYTGVRGNSLPEVHHYLRKAAGSDGSQPDGTVYLLVNRDVRSRVRQRYFPTTVKALAQRGRRARILTPGKDGQNGIVPMVRDDVIGAVVGAEKFDWAQSGSQFLPGAIAESLTSYGGHFDSPKQTKLSEFLRYGAAGSSGAVVEPFSIPAKFPVPLMHVHYADGASLAEAFYASVQSPYQLIVVGDPLARPFARFSQVTLEPPQTAASWRGTVTLHPAVLEAPGRPVRHVELWVDGVWRAEAPAGEPIVWDSRSVADGSHELRLVAVESDPIETRSYQKVRVVVANHQRRVVLDQQRIETALGERLTVSGLAPGAVEVTLMRGFETLGSSYPQQAGWRLHLDSGSLGPGESLLHVRASYPDGTAFRSAPVSVMVHEPALQSPVALVPGRAMGLKGIVTPRDGAPRVLTITGLDGRLRDIPKEVTAIESLRLEGFVHVDADGFYQLAAEGRGSLAIQFNGRAIGRWSLARGRGDAFVPLGLKAGWHRVVLDLVPAGEPWLKMVLSGAGVASVLTSDVLRH